MLGPMLDGQKNHNRPLLHCVICDGFEFISPFDIIDHLKEFHVRQPSVPNKMTPKQQKIGKSGCKEKIPIIRLERINPKRQHALYDY